VDWKTGLTLSVSAFLAVIGYIATYLNNLRLAQRKDRLDRVDRQLRELYGPLLALVTASTTTWQAFVRAHVETDFFRGGLPVALENDENAALWRHWMTTVFMPLNESMAALVLSHTDLMEDSVMPECLLTLTAHVHGYKGVVKAWENGNFSQHFSLIEFPGPELLAYVMIHYQRLKARQSELLGA